MTAAQELQAAATNLRDTAKRALHGPWTVGDDWQLYQYLEGAS